jgi:hypothetical protein
MNLLRSFFGDMYLECMAMLVCGGCFAVIVCCGG